MPGIPLSNRCQYCKRRKIKCDEAWPTCGNCKKAKKECSGPPKELKFVQNNCHSTKQEVQSTMTVDALSSESSRRPTPTGTLVDVKLHKAKDGCGTFYQMKIMQLSVPREVPTTADGRLSKRLLSCIALDNGCDLSMSRYALGLMSPRLSTSRALTNAVDCLLSTWTNLRRGLPPEEMLDLKGYGKALRSLQTALSDPDQRFCTATLAATSILHRVEVFYDLSRGTNSMTHVRGIVSIMTQMGPPTLDDELDIQLALDNYGAVMNYCMVSEQDCFYASEPWADAINTALDAGAVELEFAATCFRLCVKLASWPTLNNQLRRVYADPFSADAEMLARDVVGQTVALAADLQIMDEARTNECYNRGEIVEFIDPDSPFLARYEFSDLPTAWCFAYISMSRIVINRIMEHAMRFLGLHDPTMELLNEEMSRRIWLTYPYIIRYRTLGSTALVFPLKCAFESAGPVERCAIMSMLADLEGYKGNKPASAFSESSIMSTVLAMTGRAPFTRAQDLGVAIRSEVQRG